MKAQILKIAGVKTEAEFYKKYPTEEAFMKKHGKQLKKAAAGFSLDSDNTVVANSTTGETTTIAPLTGKQKFKKNANLALGMLGNSAGTLVGLGESLADKYGAQTDALNTYEKIAGLTGKIPKIPIAPQKYARPEYLQVSDPQKYGVPMAQDGREIKGNPTEIQNTYAPNDIYTDLGYVVPETDSTIKRYQYGGVAGGGFNPSQFMGAAGSLGGGLGSLLGGSDFEQTEEGQLAGDIGGLIGTAAAGPLGGLIGKTVFSGVGGYFGGKKNAQIKQQKNNMISNLASSGYAANLANGAFNSVARNGSSISYYEDGGYMNPEYNPQVIAKFGDYSMDQLLAPPHDADMLRAGGHLKEYTPPSASAMYTGRDLPYQMADGGQMPALGGELQTTWGGRAEHLSYNPFLPGTGETVLFRGQSHDETNGNGQSGIGVKYGSGGMADHGDADAEVERMETGRETINPITGEKSLHIAGGMRVPGYGAEAIGDEDAKGMTFKSYDVAQTKKEVKQNAILDDVTSYLATFKPLTTEDKLKMNSLLAKKVGATTRLKDIADKKTMAANVQNAILDTAREHGLESDALAKGKIKYSKPNDPYAAEFGAEIEQFGKGGKKNKKGKVAAIVTSPLNLTNLGGLAKLYQTAVSTKDPMAIGKFQRAALNTFGADEIKKLTGVKDTKKFVDGVFGSSTNTLGKAVSQKIQGMVLPQGAPNPNDAYQYPAGEVENQPTMIPQWMSADSQQANYLSGVSETDMTARAAAAKAKADADALAKGQKKGKTANMLLRTLNSIMPHFRPSNQLELDPNQLAGEMYAMSANALEPVYAQSFQPTTVQPFSISLQDQRNQIIADARAANRMAQGNPAAAAMIAAGSSEGINKVNAEEFRANQMEQARVAEKNRDIMNDAQIKNLAIYQDQAGKMAQARSNTKAENKAILDSIAEKIAKSKLENKTLGIAENTYNYRYTPSGVAYNLNPYQQFNMYGNPGQGSEGYIPEGYVPDDYMKTPTGQFIPKTLKLKTKKSKDDDEETVTARNGAIVKAIRNI